MRKFEPAAIKLANEYVAAEKRNTLEGVEEMRVIWAELRMMIVSSQKRADLIVYAHDIDDEIERRRVAHAQVNDRFIDDDDKAAAQAALNRRRRKRK